MGANIGQYTLFAAKIGRHVLAIEPLQDNINRLHKASKLMNVEKKITLIKNIVSNKRGEVRKLTFNSGNYGNQIVDKKKTYQKNDTDQFLVQTIVLD